MKTSLHGFMKAGLLDYDTKVREHWVGCHPGQVKLFVRYFARVCDILPHSTLNIPRPRERHQLKGLVEGRQRWPT